MGGVMINGCGAADSFYRIKSLKTQHCPYCRRETEYALMEVKRKIRVLYIPTVSVNTKYAVGCFRCKNGYYVSDEQKDYILSHDSSCVEIKSSGVTVHMNKPTVDVQTIPAAAEAKPAPAVNTAAPKAYSAVTSEKPAPVITPVVPKVYPAYGEKPAPREKPVCSCGAVYEEEDLFCPQCGCRLDKTKAEPEPPAEPESPAEEDTLLLEEEIFRVVEPPTPAEPAPDLMAGFRRRKMCPDCRLMFAQDKQVCGICGSPLVDKT